MQVTGDSVRFEIADIPGEPTFDGTLSGGVLKGTFSQNGGTSAFSLTRALALTEAERVGVLGRGRTLSPWFYERNLDRLHGTFSDPYEKSMSREQLAAFRQQVESQAGDEVRVEREAVSRREGLLVYTRTATFGNFSGLST